MLLQVRRDVDAGFQEQEEEEHEPGPGRARQHRGRGLPGDDRDVHRDDPGIGLGEDRGGRRLFAGMVPEERDEVEYT